MNKPAIQNKVFEECTDIEKDLQNTWCIIEGIERAIDILKKAHSPYIPQAILKESLKDYRVHEARLTCAYQLGHETSIQMYDDPRCAKERFHA